VIPRPFVEVASVGVAVPPGVLTNADLSRMLDTSDEWIVERTGSASATSPAPNRPWPC